MKFSNGCWLQKQGVESFSPAEVYETKRTMNQIRFLAPTHHINHRGDTLGGPNLTIIVSAPCKEVLRIQTFHYMGEKKKEPHFELKLDENCSLEVTETKECYRLSSGTLKLVINKHTGAMEYYRNEERLTKSKEKDLAYVRKEYKGLAYETDTKDAMMREQLSLSVGEQIYGFGEKFTPFVKNGQTVDIWNEDGGTSTEQSYKSIPFYVSNRGYGIFVNHPERVSFEVGSELVKKVTFAVPGEMLDFFVINGPTMKDVLTRYTDLTGKPALLAPWTMGLWLSTSFTTNYDEQTVTSFIDGMKNRDIPLSVFHFDCFWMKGFCWSDFTWDHEVFPDSKGMLERYHQKGLKICVWINPYIAQESILFEEGKEKGYFVTRTNGDVWQWDMWQPGMALVDFTNPQASLWFADKLEQLIDMGVDCFKTDFGERIPTKDVVYYDGSDPMKMHNYYSYLYNQCVYQLLERKRGKGEAILFARSATAGGQKFPVHWGGDCWSDYESMSESLRGGLSLTMSGFGFWSHDIGGFEDTSTPDVYKRWVAFGLMSSHSRLHGSHSYRVPWAYDEESVEVLRFFSKMKASLMPYLYMNAIKTHETGIPMMRAMVLEYMTDPVCRYLDRQYMFGDSLLVAPIFNPEGQSEYYLPNGSWTNYFTNEVVEGGSYHNETYDYFSLPCFVRENTILAVGAVDTTAEYDYANQVTLKIYQLQDGVEAKTCVYNQRAERELTITAMKSKDTITIHVEAKENKPYQIYLHNLHGLHEKNTTNLIFTEDEVGTKVTPIRFDEEVQDFSLCIE